MRPISSPAMRAEPGSLEVGRSPSVSRANIATLASAQRGRSTT